MGKALFMIVAGVCLLLFSSGVFSGGAFSSSARAQPTMLIETAAETAPETAFGPGLEEAVEAVLAEAAATEDIIGLAAAVVRNGEVTLIRTYGPRALGEDAPVDPHTTFRIASLSKGFAAGVVSQLVAEEKLSLDAGVARFAPTMQLRDPAQTQRLTLEDILSHRTGLPPYAYDNLLEAGVAPAKILGEYRKVDPICAVGRCYAYQNVAFDVVSNVVAAVDGRSYAEAVEARLFDPLGMSGASFGLEALTQDDNWARPHKRRRGEAWRAGDVRRPYYGVPAAAGVNASITDMAEWLKAQMGDAPAVLTPAMLDLTHAPRVATPGEIRRVRNIYTLDAAHYGLGWRVYDYRGARVVTHAGSVDDGYAAQIAFLPREDAGIVLLTNSRSRRFWEILPAFLDAKLCGETRKTADATDDSKDGVAPSIAGCA